MSIFFKANGSPHTICSSDVVSEDSESPELNDESENGDESVLVSASAADSQKVKPENQEKNPPRNRGKRKPSASFATQLAEVISASDKKFFEFEKDKLKRDQELEEKRMMMQEDREKRRDSMMMEFFNRLMNQPSPSHGSLPAVPTHIFPQQPPVYYANSAPPIQYGSALYPSTSAAANDPQNAGEASSFPSGNQLTDL